MVFFYTFVFVISFKVNKKKINVPSCWEDLSVKQFIDLTKTKDEVKMIEIATGQPQEIALQLIQYLPFLSTPINLNQIEAENYLMFENEIYQIPNIRQKSWNQKILLSTIFKEIQSGNSSIHETITEILAIYLQPIIDNSKLNLDSVENLATKLQSESFVKIYSVAKNIINQFNDLMTYENKMLSEKASPEQIRAGVKMFEQLGDFNAVDKLANGQIWMYETVKEIDYDTIILKLYKDKLERQFNENLRKEFKNKNNEH